MYKGTLIADLLLTVEQAERAALPHMQGQRDVRNPLQTEQLAQALGLRPADRNLGLFLVVHPKLVGALEPRHDFADVIDVHQVRAVRAPEQVRWQVLV